MDGKHVRIKCPAHSGTMFYNYKQFFSIVLQAVVDARYRFIFVDVGAYGKQSDGGIFELSPVSSFIADKTRFPQDRCPPGFDIKLPYTFVCDDAYPLKRNMMKPYTSGGAAEDIFNGRLSRARRCVECAFGILANKWRLLLRSIETDPKVADSIIKCAAVLHNVVIDKEGIHKELLAAVSEKVASSDRKNAGLKTGRRYNHSASNPIAIRNCWKKYFNSEIGSVPWQDRYIK